MTGNQKARWGSSDLEHSLDTIGQVGRRSKHNPPRQPGLVTRRHGRRRRGVKASSPTSPAPEAGQQLSGLDGVSWCPVPGCDWRSPREDPAAAVERLVRHLHYVHEQAGAEHVETFEDAQARYQS